jgi:hypothetical protein
MDGLSPALIAATPVGASTTVFFAVFFNNVFKNVALSVPAFPVSKRVGLFSEQIPALH